MATHFVTGGTGVVGRALIAELLANGEEVFALARSVGAMRALADAGADPVLGDLSRPGDWQEDAAAADVIWHLGLPRVEPPLRRGRVRRSARQAWKDADNLVALVHDDRPVILASNVLVWGDRGQEPVEEGDEPDPVATGHWALAAEQALARTRLRTVRMGWVYGPDGLFSGLVSAVRFQRFRIVGRGDNAMPLISDRDAARALRAAQALPAGVYAAAEPDVPTQEGLIHHLCAVTGAHRPDRIPPRLAAFSLGGGIVDGLSASVAVRPVRLAARGWAPSADWREDLLAVIAREGRSGSAGRQ